LYFFVKFVMMIFWKIYSPQCTMSTIRLKDGLIHDQRVFFSWSDKTHCTFTVWVLSRNLFGKRYVVRDVFVIFIHDVIHCRLWRCVPGLSTCLWI
jgi:hypothetical protein